MKIAYEFLKAMEYNKIKMEKEIYENAEEAKGKNKNGVLGQKAMIIKNLFADKKADFIKKKKNAKNNEKEQSLVRYIK